MSLNVSHSVVKKCHTFLPEFMQPPACVTCTPEWPGVKPYGSLKKLKGSGRPKQFLYRNTKTENDTSEKPSFGRNHLIDQTISTVSFGRNNLFWPK